MTFNLATFLEEAGVGRKSSIYCLNRSSFRRETRLIPSSIFGQAVQN